MVMMNVAIDASSATAQHAAALARELVTARVEAGMDRPSTLFWETLGRVANEAGHDPALYVHLLAALALIGHVGVLGVALHENDDVEAVWRRVALRLDAGATTI